MFPSLGARRDCSLSLARYMLLHHFKMDARIMETVCDLLRTATSFALLFSIAVFGIAPCQAEDLQEIVRRATAAIQSDWDADPNYAYIERDEVQKNDKTTSKPRSS